MPTLTALRYGTAEPVRAYLGDAMVWEAAITPPTIRGAATYEDNSIGAPELPIPTGTQEGDYLVAFMSVNDPGPTNLDGWTLADSVAVTGNTNSWIHRFEKVAGPDETAHAVTLTQARPVAVATIALTGVNTTSPVDASDTLAGPDSNQTAITTPGVTAIDGGVVLHVAAARCATGGAQPTWTWSGGTEIADVVSSAGSANNASVTIAHTLAEPAASVTGLTATATDNGRTVAMTVIIKGRRGTGTSGGGEPQELRDPLLWPYPADSFWNMPIGDDADLVPLNMVAPTDHFAFRWEEDLLLIDPESTNQQTIMEHTAGWSGAVRCSTRSGNPCRPAILPEYVPIPEGFTTDPGYLGNTPNHSAAIVMPDYTLVETQPLHVCGDGVPVSQYANMTWQGDSLLTGGHGPNPGMGDEPGTGGSHGGGYITAFGGTIRSHEWVPGGEIPHATKIVLNTGKWCASQETQAECFTWPALRADSGAVSGYGDSAPGNVPSIARMGMLLTLPANFDTEALTTEPARILARSIKKYGTYLCDGDHGLDVVMFAVEWSNQGRVLTEFETNFGIKGFHRPADGAMPQAQQDFLDDMRSVYEEFVIVADNSKATPGGAGATRRAPLAPPLQMPGDPPPEE